MTAGTGVIMWLGELITDRGIGNGMSILIFTPIAATFPAALWAIKVAARAGGSSRWSSLIGLVIMAAVVFIEQAQRRIPVQYAQRMVGRKMFGGTSTYIPLKVNQAGVIPVIFASQPALPAGDGRPVQPTATRRGRSWVHDLLRAGGDHPLYMLAYFLLIVFFTYFYVAITFNPRRSPTT